MPQLGGSPVIRSARSEGGVGAAVYSVKAKPLIFGVTGDVVPLVMCSSDMVIPRDPNSPGKVKPKKVNGLEREYKGQWGEIVKLFLPL